MPPEWPFETLLPETGSVKDLPAGVLRKQNDSRERFAALITSPHNARFAKVMANRLWQYHFGRGLVETTNDFGANGGRPSHPELLDWLAAEFMERGWSMKAMHRLMVTSNTYRMASTPDAADVAIDTDNKYLWRMPSHRMEAEAVVGMEAATGVGATGAAAIGVAAGMAAVAGTGAAGTGVDTLAIMGMAGTIAAGATPEVGADKR